ncbi:hypothetical protein BH10BAC3_BH10BAC3_25780 [soil metagenome]
MKKLLSVIALVTFFVAGKSQTVDEILDKHIAAIGGKEKWLTLKTIVMDGNLKANGADIAVKITGAHNKGTRQDITFSGMSGYEIYTPTEGWAYMPFQGQTKPEAKTADEVKRMLDDLDLQGNLIDYKAKGHTIEYLGKEDVEGTDCYKLKVTRKNSGDQTYFIDPASYMIVRIVSKTQAAGQEMEVTVDLSDYRDVDGLKMPFGIAQQFGNVVITDIKINVPVDDALFKPAK